MRKWIDLLESDTPSLVFDHAEDCWEFNGFGAHALLLGDPDTCLGVMSFTSCDKGQGNGERALRWIKEHAKCPAIHVYDPGERGTDSFLFWEKMCQRGLVNSMEDADMNIIYRDGEWAERD